MVALEKSGERKTPEVPVLNRSGLLFARGDLADGFQFVLIHRRPDWVSWSSENMGVCAAGRRS